MPTDEYHHAINFLSQELEGFKVAKKSLKEKYDG